LQAAFWRRPSATSSLTVYASRFSRQIGVSEDPSDDAAVSLGSEMCANNPGGLDTDGVLDLKLDNQQGLVTE
jgi:hypothetical protein